MIGAGEIVHVGLQDRQVAAEHVVEPRAPLHADFAEFLGHAPRIERIAEACVEAPRDVRVHVLEISAENPLETLRLQARRDLGADRIEIASYDGDVGGMQVDRFAHDLHLLKAVKEAALPRQVRAHDVDRPPAGTEMPEERDALVHILVAL